MQSKILYVGGDDSNHAGDSKGEIIVATFSWIYEDSIVKTFPNHRDEYSMRKWFLSPERDHLFAILSSKRYRHSSSNLSEIIPLLTSEYLKKIRYTPNAIKIYLDGYLTKWDKYKIRNKFPHLESLVIDNFTKKNKIDGGKVSKRMVCPTVVYHADVLSHNLYKTKTREELLKNEKFVFLV